MNTGGDLQPEPGEPGPFEPGSIEQNLRLGLNWIENELRTPKDYTIIQFIQSILIFKRRDAW